MSTQSATAKVDTHKVARELLIVSVLGLFLELMIIRWLATEVRIFSYFKNIPLMAAFLGLGLGFLWAGKKQDLFKLSATCFLYLSGFLSLALVLGFTFLTFVQSTQYMLFGNVNAAMPVKAITVMVAVFILTVAVFVGPGQRMGRLFRQLPPLKAYGINIVGGLLGSLLFCLLSFLYTNPGVWMVVAGVLFFLLERRLLYAMIVAFGVVYSVWLGDFVANRYFAGHVKTVWTPYYRMDITGFRPDAGALKGELVGYQIFVNYDSFQSVMDCTPEFLKKVPRDHWDFFLSDHAGAFKALKDPAHSRVLVLGCGAGADVCAALRQGVGQIDGVEIDAAIAELGKTLTPGFPYRSPNVHIYITDARTFLRNCKDKYDLILFACLDSHAAFSSLSSLRMDNYVFTKESVEGAAQCLKPDGVMALSAVLMNDWIFDRHAKEMYAAVKEKPLAFGANTTGKWPYATLIAGHDLKDRPANWISGLGPARGYNLDNPVPMAEDDWPFLFLPRRAIPSEYMLPIITLLLVSVLPVCLQFARGMRDLTNWKMFFMGTAFMLLEVRAMADLSLLFGSTWVVNSVVITGVMLVILFGTWLANRLTLKTIPVLGALLIASLLLTIFVPVSAVAGFGAMLGAALPVFVYMVPMALAATIFGLFFKASTVSSDALAFNLLGGILGILLEYASMALGIRALGWIVIGAYLSAFAAHFLSKPGTTADAVATAEV
ncbi:MAG TPA: hypothetical protein V6D22_02535 [Candidatus Obscuribacterales bacterium]